MKVDCVHCIQFPVGAKNAVEPIVARLRHLGLATEIWLEHRAGLESFARSIEVPTRAVPCELTGNPLVVLHRLILWCRLLRKEKVGILHAHQSRGAFIPLLAAALTGVKCRIYHNHGLPYLGYTGVMRMLLLGLERINSLLAHQVILVSSGNLACAITDGMAPQTKMHLLGYGSVAGMQLRHPPTRRKGQGNCRFIYVGRAVPRKGFNLLISAWHRVMKKRKDCFLIVAGCTEADCLSEGLQLPANCEFLGYTDNLMPAYSASDAIVLPSFHEGLPNCLLEAGLCGLPAIGSDIPGIRELIQDNVDGFLIPALTEENLADVLLHAALRVNELPDMGNRMSAKLNERFDRDFVLSQVVSFYRRIGALS